MQIEKVTITTDASGDATAYTGYFTGQVVAIRYVKDDYANGVDFTITAETGGNTFWTEANVNASETVFPTDVVDDTAGADTATRGPCWCLDDRVKIVIDEGGNAKNGTFWIFWK